MLQQTQVDRVIPKYQQFLEHFPSVQALANASLSAVLTLWVGLGYNRRAQYLQKTAQAILSDHEGHFPKERTVLESLPGVGPYTAGAICTFAYNQPVTLIETNIRAVFLYHFFPLQKTVSDKDVLPLIAQELWHQNPREWYAALMDYGSCLKKVVPNPSRKSRHHTKQSRFVGSVREVRGNVLKILTKHQKISKQELHMKVVGNRDYLEKVLDSLQRESIVKIEGSTIAIKE